VQDSGIDTYRWLYLTEETFNSMNTTAKWNTQFIGEINYEIRKNM
jgi:hypothetical protein